MANRYHLDLKIKALNEIASNDGDVSLVSRNSKIPARTLRDWLRDERELRRQYQARRRREAQRRVDDLQLAMLERVEKILSRMNDETLDKAPLNQLASALGALVGNALKLEEVRDDGVAEEDRVIRFEHYYDGAVQETPPWAGASEGFDRSLQGSGVWEALGEDGVGQADDTGGGAEAEALLVAGADAADGEPGLARFESEYAANGRHRQQRDRAPN